MRLAAVVILTALIHLVSTLAYSVRLSGVRTGRLAIATSLFSIVSLTAQTANTIQGPLLTKMVERLIYQFNGTPEYPAQAAALAGTFRVVLWFATVGTLAGVLLTPTFVNLFTRTIYAFEQAGSIFAMTRKLISLGKISRATASLRPPRPQMVAEAIRMGRDDPERRIPPWLLALNAGIVALFTTGVLSSIYAGVLIPELRTTASSLSAIINGAGTILLAMVVDPTTAVITDQAMRGDRPEGDVKAMVAWLVISRVAGTVLAQALFYPGAWLIAHAARIV